MTRYIKSGSVTRVPEINSELEKIATSQQDFLTRSGETPNNMLSNLDMNSYRIINVADPVFDNDLVKLKTLGNYLTSEDTYSRVEIDSKDEQTFENAKAYVDGRIEGAPEDALIIKQGDNLSLLVNDQKYLQGTEDLASLQALSPTEDEEYFFLRSTFTHYKLRGLGYTAKLGDVVFANGRVASKLNNFTTQELIASDFTLTTGSLVTTNGYYLSGDKGEGSWEVTGNTVFASQTPSDTITARISTAAGQELEYTGFGRGTDKEVNIRALGARGGFLVEDTAALEAAVAWCSESGTNRSTGGGTILLGEISLHIDRTIVISESNIFIKGIGSGGFQSGIGGIRDSAVSRIRWEGAATSTPMIHFLRPSNSELKVRGGLSDLMLDCFNLAGEGLRLTSWGDGRFKDLLIYASTFAALRLNCHSTYTGANPFDCLRNKFEGVYTTCKNIAGNTSTGVLLEGEGEVNSCFNRFTDCVFDYGEANSPALSGSFIMRDTDNNSLLNCNTPHLIFASGDDGGGSSSRYNWSHNCEIEYVTAKASQIGGFSSFNNIVSGLNNSNASGNIVTQGGANGSDDGQMLVYDTNGFKTRWEHAVLGMTPLAQPANPEEGDVYYDLTSKEILFYNGTSWKSLFNTSDNITTLSDLGGDPNVDVGSLITSSIVGFFDYVDLEGKTWIATSLNSTAEAVREDLNQVKFYNGTLQTSNALSTTTDVQTFAPYSFSELQPSQTKSRVLDWAGLNTLWLGTSIPHQGVNVDGYPELIGEKLNCNVFNFAWSGSHANYDIDGPADDLNTIRALSMTEADRLAGLALYGASSVYDDSFNAITKASEQTADFRIASRFASNPMDVVVLDHNHNDRRTTYGYTANNKAISSVILGATTVVTVNDTSGLAVGDGCYFTIDGIANLNYAAGRIVSIVNNDVEVAIASTGFTGTFISGALVWVDRTTLKGSFDFLIAYIKNQGIIHSRPNVEIVLAGAPSYFTNNSNRDYDIWSVNQRIRKIAKEWDLGYFDIASSLDLTFEDHLIYLPDAVHPTTLATRNVFKNHWCQWLTGGKQFTPDVSLDLSSYLQAADLAGYVETTDNELITGLSGDLGSGFDIDSLTEATGWYTGYGGTSGNASVGSNPFPTLNGAFSLAVQKGINNTSGKYTVQTAIAFLTTVQVKVRSIATAAGGWSNWEEVYHTGNLDISGLTTRVSDLETFDATAGTAYTADVTTSATDTTAGRLTRVGDFGIGGRTSQGLTNADSATLGSFQTSGQLTEATAVAANFPSLGVAGTQPVWWNILTYGETSRIVQEATEVFSVTGPTVNVPRKFLRNKQDSSWDDWVEVWTEGNLVKTTSATDTTSGSVLTIDGAGGYLGLGGTTGIIPADLDTITAGGFYAYSSATLNKPSASLNGTCLHVSRFSGSTGIRYSQQAIDELGDAYFRNNINGVWGAWKRVVDSTNLNLFDGITGELCNTGLAASGTNAWFFFDIFKDTDPTGISLTGTFDVYRSATLVQAGVTVLFSNISTKRKGLVTVAGLTGLTTNENLQLRFGSTASIEFT